MTKWMRMTKRRKDRQKSPKANAIFRLKISWPFQKRRSLRGAAGRCVPDTGKNGKLPAALAGFGGASQKPRLLAATHRFLGDATKRLHFVWRPCRSRARPLIATNDVLYHDPSRRRSQDVLTCIRATCRIDEAGFRLHRNAERH